MNSIKTGSVSANGIDFTYIEKGEGELMLCFHGFPDNAGSFRHQLDTFSRAGYHVVAPFMRGYAPTSPAPNNQYHAAYLGLDAAALIEALGYDKAVLVGHDFGATAAYAAAIIAPEKVTAMVTTAVPYGPKLGQAMVMDHLQQRRSWYVFYFQTLLAEMALPLNDFAFIDFLWKDWSPGWKYPTSVINDVKKTLASPGVLSAALGYYRSPFSGVPSDPAAEELQGRIGNEPIQAPALYIHGVDDGCIGADISDGMEDFFTGRFEKQMVKGAGHFVHQETPDIFNKLVINFLS